ncbi:MAG TPA: hypothetical protein VGB55_14505 [Tepidisphaeraceae bacterium]|jgi:hypothetical protein
MEGATVISATPVNFAAGYKTDIHTISDLSAKMLISASSAGRISGTRFDYLLLVRNGADGKR